jgi:hypothetical protein
MKESLQEKLLRQKRQMDYQMYKYGNTTRLHTPKDSNKYWTLKKRAARKRRKADRKRWLENLDENRKMSRERSNYKRNHNKVTTGN